MERIFHGFARRVAPRMALAHTLNCSPFGDVFSALEHPADNYCRNGRPLGLRVAIFQGSLRPPRLCVQQALEIVKCRVCKTQDFINCYLPSPSHPPKFPIPPPTTCHCRSLQSTMHSHKFPYTGGEGSVKPGVSRPGCSLSPEKHVCGYLADPNEARTVETITFYCEKFAADSHQLHG